jgi:hypothetical protein
MKVNLQRFASLAVVSSFALTACTSNTPPLTPGPENPSTDSPTIWKNQDIGQPAKPGSSSSSDTAVTVKASGTDIWNAKDSFHFVYQAAPKNFKLTALVTAPSKTNDWAKSGLMLRDSLADNSSNAIIALLAKGRDRFQTRSSNGAATTSPADNDSPLKAYLRLERQDTVVIGSSSSDGLTWVERGRTTIAFGANPVLGFALTSHDDTQLSTATFSEIKLETTAAPIPAPTPSPLPTPAPSLSGIGFWATATPSFTI